MTSTNLINSIKLETQTAANMQGVESIVVILLLSNGKEQTITLNPNNTWRIKPSDSNGLVRFEYVNDKENEVMAVSTYTIIEHVNVVLIDPDKVDGFKVNYRHSVTTSTNVQSDE